MSLYHLLERELISFDIPSIDFSRANPRTAQKQEEANNISIYPNPVRDALMISTSNNSIIQKISIYTLQGREIFSEIYSSNNVQIDVSSINAGIYLIHITKENGEIYTAKLIIN